MAFQSDKDGFLIGGEAVVLLGAIDRSLARIGHDVRAIRASMAGAKTATKTVVATPPYSRRGSGAYVVSARARDASGRFVKSESIATPVSRSGITKTSSPLSESVLTGSSDTGTTSRTEGIKERDKDGKFLSNGRRGDPAESVGRAIGDRIAGVIRGGAEGIEQADPAVQALREIATPMARGYELLGIGGRGERRKEGWLRRIFGALTGLKKEEATSNKEQIKRLKAIEGKPVGSTGNRGLFGGLLGGLSKLPFVGPVLSSIAGFIGGAAGSVRKFSTVAGKGLLRRIPLVGNVLAGVGEASSIYASESDDSLTRRQKDENAGRSVGGFAGTVGGMYGGAAIGAAIGTAVMPVIGTAIGGVLGGVAGMFAGDRVGQVLGETFGGWVNDLRKYDIPGKIVFAWDAFVSAASDAWDVVTDAGESFWDFLRRSRPVKYAEDVFEHSSAGKGIRKLSELRNWNQHKAVLANASEGDPKVAALMAMQSRFESGFDPSARPDKKGATAFGFGQFTDAAWGDAIKKWGGKYGLSGKETPSAMRAIRKDTGWQAAMLSELTKENMEAGRRYAGLAGADDAANVYAMHNLGPGDGPRFLKALSNNKNMNLSEALVGGRSIDPKEAARIRGLIESNPSLYKETANGVSRVLTVGESYARMSRLMHAGDTYAEEAASLVSARSGDRIARPASSPMPTATASAQVPILRAPRLSVPSISEAPAISQQLGTNKDKPISVTMPTPDAGQDMRDRHIAHIATGGIGGMR